MNIKFRVLPIIALAMALLFAPQARAEQRAATAGVDTSAPTINLDKTSLDNGGDFVISGKAPAGSQVYIELWSAEKTVKSNRFDGKKDEKTGKIPYKFYITKDMPAFYKIVAPVEMAGALDKAKAAGKKWKYSEVLKEIGADAAYTVPAKIQIDNYQATVMASILGSRGTLLPPMDEKASKRESMKLVKARFVSVGNLLSAKVETTADGSYSAKVSIRSGLAPGKYSARVTAVTERIKEGDKETVQKITSEVASFENKIAFPTVYLSTAGTSINIIWPFLLASAVTIFGVLMGAGGGFILNPLLLMFFPLPHTVVAGTVMPTVLFAQGTGIVNYSKIKFINWKLGCGIGCAMLVGGFIGPKLTEMITLDQFKFLFGWVLLILAALMFWQTTPGYLANNKKEQAILKEFKKRAAEAVKAKG
ncbi:MAG: sulfite exporter TauE/SafE family protein [Proteobacteria bacterium]|nr:sulfite exporter TauE/SafE family protein [Desulfocapsa sp.]MBU3943100.1 sulfite exporter TauE/SafE family protein [Pseudomonadota bacterium]MBU3983847.1 sulfite exporter TauE/SafE family protein [Pseudomonadota bacterium]MBU4028965.1 sulfite exporter TauE/SafE family protein [Pseudomonadota bacterium]MBU4042126.1 sulfite exporter TauE/SafE family protein [Pseudomonadota bacterium]